MKPSPPRPVAGPAKFHREASLLGDRISASDHHGGWRDQSTQADTEHMKKDFGSGLHRCLIEGK